MTKVLSLSEEKQTQAYEINVDFFKKRAEISKDKSKAKEDKKAEIQTARKAYVASLKEVIGNDEFKKWIFVLQAK